MEQAFLEGFILQASLIFAIGAQNIFVLESGLRRHHHLTVSVVCFLCDLFLIMLGVAGAATLFNQFPDIKILFGVLGVAFLFHYGFTKFRTREEEIVLNDVAHRNNSLKTTIVKAMTFSLINPHAYLDGIVLIGGYSTKYGELELRILVGLGASLFSLVWFLCLSSASGAMKPLLESPKRMRVILSTAGIVLMLLSAKLSVDVVGWIRESNSFTAIAFENWEVPHASR